LSIFELFAIAQAWASAGAAEHHAPSFHQIWFPLGNFLIFAYIVHRFAVPPLRDFLRFRRQEMVTAIQSAAEHKQRAQATVQDYQNRLAHLEGEVRSIQDSLRVEGEREKAKMLQEAERVASKIKEDNILLAEQEVKVAQHNIRQQIASDAAASARELIKRHLTADDQGRLVADFIVSIRDVR